jgi:hypothetical protein
VPAVLDAAPRRTVVTLRPPGHDASEDQLQALRAFDSFLASRDDRVFVLSGAAGTGKTTLLDQMMARVWLVWMPTGIMLAAIGALFLIALATLWLPARVVRRLVRMCRARASSRPTP